MKNEKLTAVLAVLCCLELPCAAVQAIDDADMDTIVVTGKRYSEEKPKVEKDVVLPAGMATQRTQRVTHQQIEQTAASDVYDALRLLPNVQIHSSGTGFGSRVSLRGMGTKDALILVNGRRLAGEDTSTAQNLLALDRLNVHQIDHIEVVRGAAAAQYGSDALAGVINIVTQSAGGKPSQTVGVSTGTAAVSNYYHFDFGQTGKFKSSLDLNFSELRPWTRHKLNVEANGQTIGRFAAGNLQGPKQQYQFSGTYEFNKNKSLTLDLGYYKDKLHGQWGSFSLQKNNLARAYPQIPSFAFAYMPDSTALPDAKLETTRRDAALTFNGKGEKDTYEVRTQYSKLHKFRFVPLPNLTPQTDGAAPSRGAFSLGAAGDETNDYTIWSLAAKDTHKINGEHTLIFGSEYDHYNVDGDNFGEKGGSRDVSTEAAYLLDEWRPGTRWLIIPSLRYDHHSRFGSQTTPNLGVTYSLTEHQRFIANVGKGYKTPGVSELYMDLPLGVYTILGNENLRPEKSRNWDLSYEGEWGRTFGKITYFHNDIENRISTHRLFGTYYQFYNVPGTSKLHGIELTLGRQLTKKWLLQATSNWTTASNRGEMADGIGQGVDGIAGNVTTLQLIYDDQKAQGWNASLYQQWIHDYYESDTGSRYSYAVTNLTVSRKFKNGLRLFAGMDNLFNKKIDAIYLDGRLWKTGLEWRL